MPGTRSPRVLELLRLAESQPDVVRLHPYLADPDPRVRRAAVIALAETVPPGPESRWPKRRAIRALKDPDHRVRLRGRPARLPAATRYLAAGAVRAAPAWEVRAAAAQALAAATADIAVGPLTKAAGDPHADVRKAAVIALAQFRGHPDAAAALAVARSDADADVRAYAR